MGETRLVNAAYIINSKTRFRVIFDKDDEMWPFKLVTVSLHTNCQIHGLKRYFHTNEAS